ncbi:MAG: hypothetical protein ABI743_05130 [bacterium]
MTLTETLRTPLANAVQATYDFQFNTETKTWHVDAKFSVKSPEDKLDVTGTASWDFTVRGVCSHEPKLRIRDAMTAMGLDTHPRAEAIFELLDLQFRNQRGAIIDQVFQVYESGKPTNF